MKKVIVFGATGNLGAYITIYLKSVGYDVIAVGHRKDDNGFFASRGMKYYSVDITKPEEFEQLPITYRKYLLCGSFCRRVTFPLFFSC